MLEILLVALVIFILAVVMTMTGRGGGNFYILTLVIAGLPMHEAASTGQFILFTSAVSAALVFRKGKNMLLPLALFLGGITSTTAFLGGFAAHQFSGESLKIIFAIFLAIAGLSMFLKSQRKDKRREDRPGFWSFKSGNQLYIINLWVAVPVAMTAGFFSGMVGVSGGSFLVPLMVLACGVPVHLAVGTATAIVASTAFSGFVGHALNNAFNAHWALPLASATILGGILGGKIALKTRPVFLKTLFAVTTLVASVLMLLNTLFSG
jgi:uncharacterized protein